KIDEFFFFQGRLNTYWVITGRVSTYNYGLNSDGSTTLLSQKVSTVGHTGNGTNILDGDYDDYGNVLKRRVITTTGFGDDQFGSLTQLITDVYDYSEVDEVSWWVKPKSHSVTSSGKTSAVMPPLPAGTIPTDLSGERKVTKYFLDWSNNRDLVKEKTSWSSSDGNGSLTVEYTYNSYGLPTKVVTNPPASETEEDNSRQVTTTYTKDGELEAADGYFVYQVTNHLGHKVTTNVAPEFGIPTKVVDTNNNKTVTEIDELGRVVSVQSDLAPKIYTRYAECNACANENVKFSVSTYQAGAPVVTEYKDILGRTWATASTAFDSSELVVQKVEYNRLGQVLFESVPRTLNSVDVDIAEGTHFNKYDILGRLTEKLIDNTLTGLTVKYSFSGYKTNITTNDFTMSRTYNGIGQLMQTTDADEGVTRYAYDALGNPIVLLDANLNPITAKYNARGQKLWVNDPNMGLKQFDYTIFGEVSKELDANADTIEYFYDALGRLKTRKINNAVEAQFTYDDCINGVGMLCQSVGLLNETMTKSIKYDQTSRPFRTVTEIGGEKFITTTRYDTNYGRPKSLTYPKTRLTLAFEYTANGYQSVIKNAANSHIYKKITEVDARGHMLSADLNNQLMSVSANYDVSTGQMLSTGAVTATAFQRHFISYTYDNYDNLHTQHTEWLDANNVNQSADETYYYDKLHRLDYTQLSGGNLVNYEYDSVGNITSKSDFASEYNYGSINRDVSNGFAGPNAVRGLLGHSGNYSYDLNGNLLSGGGKELTYNAFNKPTSIKKNNITSQFYYGPDLMRYKQVKSGAGISQETTIYIDKLFEQISQDGVVKYKNYIDDIAVFTRTESGGAVSDNVDYLHRDRLGSVVTVTDSDGKVIDNKSFDAFGKPRKISMEQILPATLTGVLSESNIIGGRLATTRGFTDHEHLDDAELIHMNGRVYDYNLGRFLSVDPVIQDPGNSQSMNPYSYIMNYPLSGTDPSGYESEKIEKTVKVVSSSAHSRIQRKSTVSVVGDKSNGTVKVTGKNGAHVKQVANKIKNEVSGFDGGGADIGGQQSVAQQGNGNNVVGSSPSQESDSNSKLGPSIKIADNCSASCEFKNLMDAQRKLDLEHNEKYKNNPFDPLDYSGEDNAESKKQNIRNPDSGSSKLKLEIKLAKFLEAVISSEGVDYKGILKSGGMEVKFGKDGEAYIKYGGKSFGMNELGATGFGLDALKVMSFKLKMTDSGKLEWGAKVKFFNGKVSAGLSGEFDFDPVGAARDGMVGRALQKHWDQIP
ncbi:RHS repeat domain-containing protein, partial [Aliikangiella maris]